MKVSTILKLIERAREPLLKEAHIKAYAEAIIKQDRERVKQELDNRSYMYTLDDIVNGTSIILD